MVCISKECSYRLNNCRRASVAELSLNLDSHLRTVASGSIQVQTAPENRMGTRESTKSLFNVNVFLPNSAVASFVDACWSSSSGVSLAVEVKISYSSNDHFDQTWPLSGISNIE